MQPGCVVRFRRRDWVLLPGDDETIYRLRPLTGVTDEVVAVCRRLAKVIENVLVEEAVRPSQFPPPTVDDLSDAAGASLLWHAARLVLRDGAAPLRSLGRISIRPRVYQFVPLLMALRLDPVRLFIADDVGVGKTIEALLVARELIDRGEVRRLAVLCPPYLCDQWQKEMREKFNLDAVVIGSSTVGWLERDKPPTVSIYEHYSYQVISIDWVKSDRNRYLFLQGCPELVIVDEAHGAARADSHRKSQQQRHKLLREVAKDPRRHLILLTATPHSGIEAAFQSLLGLLRPEFEQWNVGQLTEEQRKELALHFVQRTRKDITLAWQGEHCFPERESTDQTYELSPAYRELFRRTFDFCGKLVQTGERLERRRRFHNWGALVLLRCVMSSPAAAVVALEKRSAGGSGDEDDVVFSGFVFEATDRSTKDETPTLPLEEGAKSLGPAEQRQLRQLASLARQLHEEGQDSKVQKCVAIVRELLDEGLHPIVWCRYVATAEYVAEKLRAALEDHVQVAVVTGRLDEEARRIKIDEIDPERPRVLVATDCLSEGLNLQEKFTAVLHYDLPWNPNRLEQREGRVDRYGQTARRVKVVRFYGQDNPVDGAVIRVLLEKAREIHQTLGTYVPVPEESETVMEAVLKALFLQRDKKDRQLTLFDEEEIERFHQQWDRDAERERINRTRFAQRALKPDEVQRELKAADAVLGDPAAVRDFVLNAAQRVGLAVEPDRRNPDVFQVHLSPQALATVPEPIRFELPSASSAARRPVWRISFVSPTPEGAEYVGRNHRFVAALAQYLLEDSLTSGSDAIAPRCGVVRTQAVDVLTTLLLLRVRYLVEIPGAAPLLSEEALVCGYRRMGQDATDWLETGNALKLLGQARPDANVPMAEKRELVQFTLDGIGPWNASNGRWGQAGAIQRGLSDILTRRASELEQSHKRIRKAVSLRVRELKVRPQFPPDLLGLLVLQPVAGRGRQI